jgi:hypothetical protein
VTPGQDPSGRVIYVVNEMLPPTGESIEGSHKHLNPPIFPVFLKSRQRLDQLFFISPITVYTNIALLKAAHLRTMIVNLGSQLALFIDVRFHVYPPMPTLDGKEKKEELRDIKIKLHCPSPSEENNHYFRNFPVTACSLLP